LFSTDCAEIFRRLLAGRGFARQPMRSIEGLRKRRQESARQPAASSSRVKRRVKFRQVPSSPVKPLLDGASCKFNDLRGKSLTAALEPEPKRPAPL
jgi:hypothetical protein